ncbi:MAG: hypothetical protein QNJ16_06260 [Rhodobacter sp.]|nr:hypothetical protein [Rhodobacter sp.]
MVVDEMVDYAKHNKGGLAEPFGGAAAPQNGELRELVKLLARIAAEKDYNELLETSKTSYDGPEKKGPVL